jgi:catechol 2,3-dioxygenase-like lactoylglutathione lyase family enzyme
MAVKLAHVCIETSDLEKTESFYQLIGLKRRFEFKNKQQQLVGFYLAFDNETFIEVIKVSEVTGSGVIRHFAIEVDDVNEIHQRLTKAGVEVSEKEFAGDRQWMITCNDPNGIFVELQQYTDESMQRVGGVCEVDYQP